MTAGRFYNICEKINGAVQEDLRSGLELETARVRLGHEQGTAELLPAPFTCVFTSSFAFIFHTNFFL